MMKVLRREELVLEYKRCLSAAVRPAAWLICSESEGDLIRKTITNSKDLPDEISLQEDQYLVFLDENDHIACFFC